MKAGAENTKDIKIYLLIGVVVLICHGLLIINDGLYYDDIHLIDVLQSGNWDELHSFQSMYGNTLAAYYDWLFSVFENPVFAFKLTAFLSLLFSAFLIYHICTESGFIGSTESVFIALLSVVYPASLMTFVINLSFHFVCLMLFLLAVYFAMITVRVNKKRALLLRVLASALFFLSYSTNSILVFHFGFLLFYYLYTQGELGRRILEKPFSFFKRHWELILLPFIFWMWKQLFTPVHGFAITDMETYNKVVIDPVIYVQLYAKLFKSIGYHIGLIAFHPIFFIGTLIIVAFIYCGLKLKWHQQFQSRKSLVYLIPIGLILLFAASFAYVAVGKGFGDGTGIGNNGFESRNMLLCGIPMAIILVSAISIILDTMPRLKVIILCAIVVTFSIFRISYYVVWQAESVKNQSTLHNLVNMTSGSEDYHVIGIFDAYPIAGNDTLLWWAIAFKRTFGDFTRFGFYEKRVKETDDGPVWKYRYPELYGSESQPHHWYTLEDIRKLITGFFKNVNPIYFNPKGRQATLTIERGAFNNNLELVWKYYYYKFFQPDKLGEFLTRITRLSLIERFPHNPLLEFE
jgi:hypothetical protein